MKQELKQRSAGFFIKLTDEQRYWLNNNCCPMCGLPKDKWKRRKDWRCCSTDCTDELSKVSFFWQDTREKVFKRDKFTCVKCGKKCGRETLIGDHIIPIALGGEEWDLKNIQTLCIKCDKVKTKEDHGKIALQRRINKIQDKNKTIDTH